MSGLFTGPCQHLTKEGLTEVEARLKPEGIEQGAHLRDLSLLFCLQQHTQDSQGSESEPIGRMAPFLFVDENQIRSELQAEHERLSFAQVEIPP